MNVLPIEYAKLDSPLNHVNDALIGIPIRDMDSLQTESPQHCLARNMVRTSNIVRGKGQAVAAFLEQLPETRQVTRRKVLTGKQKEWDRVGGADGNQSVLRITTSRHLQKQRGAA